MKTNKSKNIYTTVLIFSVVSLLLFIFCIWPLFVGIKKNSDDLISAKNSMFALKQQINETKIFKNNFEGYKTNLDKIDQLFIDSDDTVDFIQFIEATAYTYGVTSKISIPQSSTTSNQFTVFQVSFEGSFAAISSFTREIEAGPYMVEIENLTIHNILDKSKKADATFAIKVFTK